MPQLVCALASHVQCMCIRIHVAATTAKLACGGVLFLSMIMFDLCGPPSSSPHPQVAAARLRQAKPSNATGPSYWLQPQAVWPSY